MRNVAITGRMAAGKSTLSNILVDDHGFVRASFAARLKQLASDVYNGGQPIEKGDLYFVTDESDGLTESLTGREVLQQLGQAVKALDRDFWIRWMLADYDKGAGKYSIPVVLDDLRFPYEAEALRQRGWLIVKVETPLGVRLDRYQRIYGRIPTAEELNHPSEVQVDLVVPDITVRGDANAHWVIEDILEVADGRVELSA